VLHEVGHAHGGGAAAAVLAVDDGAASALRLAPDGVGAAVEVAVQVLVRVVVHRDAQQGHVLRDGERLLPGHVDAQRHRLLLDERRAAGGPRVADEQGSGHLTQLEHPDWSGGDGGRGAGLTLTGCLTCLIEDKM